MCIVFGIYINVCCRTSVRQVAIYDVADLSSAMYTIDLNTSPSILIPQYDEDSSVLFATGRASTTVTVMLVIIRMCHLSIIIIIMFIMS